MKPAIAIIGMACRYGDANLPAELWDNALAQRRSFRRIPAVRLNRDDYVTDDARDVDRTYVANASVLEGYQFDRGKYRVGASTYRSTDLSHWLALDVAAEALADAGFEHGDGLPRDTTGVLIGNTLTGEFSRANLMRLRWPYVHRVLDATMKDQGLSDSQRQQIIAEMHDRYKASFPAPDEDMLAGGLANTIAGRVCNHFDLHGGGYTVDGACSSSLLSIATACAALTEGDIDAAIAGGVDLSLDPFELVGFARVGALAPRLMRVYDKRSCGFWPGEGCGMVVLMRYEDAVKQGRRIDAVIRGWGISSDGSGGITRPEVGGQLLAFERAYRRAGFGIDTVGYVEGHGTGTALGDATELRVLTEARSAALNGRRGGEPLVVGSIKANIGHTKAAAGIAGLLKATLAVREQVLPPATGCLEPHDLLCGEKPLLRVLHEPEEWPADRPIRAAVSSMGFGGINTHIVLEGVADQPRRRLSRRARSVGRSAQQAELFLFSGGDRAALREAVRRTAGYAIDLSWAELGDLAAALQREAGQRAHRAAVVASSPEELHDRLKQLLERLDDESHNGAAWVDAKQGVFTGHAVSPPRIGLLFPGQASPTYLTGGAWARRFDFIDALYEQAKLQRASNLSDTRIAQPAIAAASLAGVRALDQLDIEANVAVGHSVGEFAALCWAGAWDEAATLRLVTARGRIMAERGEGDGVMASIAATSDRVQSLLDGDGAVIACINGPQQTVVSGRTDCVKRVVDRAKQQGITASVLPVSHAFHSPLMAPAAAALGQQLAAESARPPQRTVASTITGAALPHDADLTTLLVDQLTMPVRFTAAATTADQDVDLWIECGPGHVLTHLISQLTDTPVVAMDAGGDSVTGLLSAAAAAWVMGAAVNHAALFERRFTRPFDLDYQPSFLVNPCELAPLLDAERAPAVPIAAPPPIDAKEDRTDVAAEDEEPVDDELTPLELIRQLVARQTELPLEAIRGEDRLLGDLHLNSIAVGQVVVEATRRFKLAPPRDPTHYADATVAGLAEAIAQLRQTGAAPTEREAKPRVPEGVDAWVRPFVVHHVERPAAALRTAEGPGQWHVFAEPGDPFAEALRQAVARLDAGDGVILCPAAEPDEAYVRTLLNAAHQVLKRRDPIRFVLVERDGGGAAGFAKTLRLEAPHVTVCIVDVPADHPQAVQWVVHEAITAIDFAEVRYDRDGRRTEPFLRVMPPIPDDSEEQGIPLDADDVLLVTGGGKGIAAECALDLAKRTGVKLLLLGRSRPEDDAELSRNLRRMTDAGVRLSYRIADVTHDAAVRDAVAAAVGELGPITAVMHGAGINVPQLIAGLDPAAVMRTLDPKLRGLKNVLDAVDPNHLKLLVTFSSIIGRVGLSGEADYALANGWMSLLTERFAAAHPACRCVAMEWSVWSGVGMGERLGRIDALAREGISAITPDQGVEAMCHLIARPLDQPTVVVTGRFGDPPTAKLDRLDLPLLRFIEKPRVHYPRVELVTDVNLSVANDPYLNEHVYRGQRLLPAVVGLEAMAQVAAALFDDSVRQSGLTPVFEDVQLDRPIVLPLRGRMTIRLAALRRTDGWVDVSLRSEESDFAVDHFRARCRFDDPDPDPGTGTGATRIAGTKRQRAAWAPNGAPPLPLIPEQDLYGGLMFHTGRFRRIDRYRLLRATECWAELKPDDPASPWFGQYLPQDLLLGDPAARDAAIHGIQVCIPHARLLPIGVERLITGRLDPASALAIHARERFRQGDLFVYDVDLVDADGRIVEQWQGLRLKRIDAIALPPTWTLPLLAPYVERRLQEMNPAARVAVTIDRNGYNDLAAASPAAQGAVRRRPDGKPVTNDDRHMSIAHADALTLAVAADDAVGCDLEPVAPRSPDVWRGLLGEQRFSIAQTIARQTGEDPDIAATRLWTAIEAIKKAGRPVDTPLTLASVGDDAWVALRCGAMTAATYVARLDAHTPPLVVTVLAMNDAPPPPREL